MLQSICGIIDAASPQLESLSKSIWSHPELNFEEVHAHQCITEMLAKEGFQMEKSYHLQTAFRACFSVNGQMSKSKLYFFIKFIILMESQESHPTCILICCIQISIEWFKKYMSSLTTQSQHKFDKKFQ